MGSEPLPRARIEPRGVGGHLEHLGAEARVHVRTVGRLTLFVVRVLGGVTIALVGIALLVWLAPTPRTKPMQDLERMQRDMQRQIEQSRRALEQVQAMQHLMEMPHYQLPPPPHIAAPPQSRDPHERPAPRPPRHKPPRRHHDSRPAR